MMYTDCRKYVQHSGRKCTCSDEFNRSFVYKNAHPRANILEMLRENRILSALKSEESFLFWKTFYISVKEKFSKI